ncbi:MAG: ABC transporter substrate-binding protein [Pseudomonadota bacterium]
MNKISLLALPLLGLLVLFGQGACTPHPQPPLAIGINTWPGYAPLWLAGESLDDIHMVQYPSTSDVIKDFQGEILDAAAVTLDEALKLAASGMDIDIVLPLDVSHGADGLVAKDTIHELAELKGKRIGVENTALGAYLLGRSLEKAGLKTNDVIIVPLEIPDHPKAWANGAIDAAITFEPQLSQLRAANGRILLDTRDLPNEVIDVLVVRRDAVREHRDALERLSASWHQIIANLDSQPSLTLPAIATASGYSTDALRLAYSGLTFPNRSNAEMMLAGPMSPLCSSLRGMAAIMVGQGLLPHHPGRLPFPCHEGRDAR